MVGVFLLYYSVGSDIELSDNLGNIQNYLAILNICYLLILNV